ncbi:MAG: 4a-hydroxytetrahydrobiopterin dehydratase [Proteobacteria bacterium]|nr:4a-hydroxytetrahydrobiopterin dehydratase [Pseudomonadota bacterium]
MTDDALAQKKCVPCRGGVPILNPDEVRSLLPQAAGWSALENHHKIAGQFKFKNFRQTLDFVIAVGELAEAEFHHPVSINFGWGFCAIALQTTKIKGLHENDFIMAAKINQIAAAMAAGQ